MKVYFRNINDAEASFVGEMTMEELKDFMHSIKKEGLYIKNQDGEYSDLIYPDSVEKLYYHEVEKCFWVEVLWEKDGY